MPDTLPALVVSAPAALALGMVFGMGPCLVSCLPYLGPVLLNNDGGVRRAWQLWLPLAGGRLLAYASLGAAAGWLGQTVARADLDPSVRLAVGWATVLMGVALWWQARRRHASACTRPPAATAVVQWVPRREPPRPLLPGGLFLMGVGLALNLCAPLGMVLVSAAATQDAWQGVTLSLGFGLGALLVPTLVYVVGLAYVGTQLRQHLGRWLPWIEHASAALLLLSGLRQLL